MCLFLQIFEQTRTITIASGSRLMENCFLFPQKWKSVGAKSNDKKKPPRKRGKVHVI